MSTDRLRSAYDTDQPWIVYVYGRTVETWWPFWRSTRVLGHACVVCQCAVCGDRTKIWLRIPRRGPVPDRGNHPARDAYLTAHIHPDRGHPMSWALPMLNPAAHEGGINLDLLGMRLEVDVNEEPHQPQPRKGTS